MAWLLGNQVQKSKEKSTRSMAVGMEERGGKDSIGGIFQRLGREVNRLLSGDSSSTQGQSE